MHVCACVWVLLAQLRLTACQRVVPNMPHLFRAGQEANEHSLEAEEYENGMGERGEKNSKEMKNEYDIPPVSVAAPFPSLCSHKLEIASVGFHS